MAAIEIVPDVFYVCWFYFDIPPQCSKFGKGGNFVGILGCKAGEEMGKTTWQFQCRFRNYRDERIFEHEFTVLGFRLFDMTQKDASDRIQLFIYFAKQKIAARGWKGNIPAQ